jgi:hypothetical protein
MANSNAAVAAVSAVSAELRAHLASKQVKSKPTPRQEHCVLILKANTGTCISSTVSQNMHNQKRKIIQVDGL